MMNKNGNNNILLCDMGGTHARFAKFISEGEYSNFQKYRLNDFDSIEEIIQKYIYASGVEFNDARFAVARTPRDGVISYKRFAGDPDYIIDFNKIKKHFLWSNMNLLNDLEAGAYGTKCITDGQIETVIPSKGNKWNDNKILISVGTGVGHACITNNEILKTGGGHFLPVTVTKEHRDLEQFISNKKGGDAGIIMEDFVSGRGLRMMSEFISGKSNDELSPHEFMEDLKNYPQAVRLFFEFLGLHAHTLVCVTGFYGGVYLTGGVIDNLIKNGLVNWNAFEQYFAYEKMSGVLDRLQSVSINYVLHDELPLLGLTVIE